MDVNGSTGNISSVEGPSPFEDIPAILTAVVLALIILTTVIGNVLVIAAIYSEKNLQSVANYLIVSLAVADLMVACLVMPLGAFYEVCWPLGPELCDIWTSSDVLCCTASILHLVAIAIDRYWAVTDLNYIQARNPRRIGMLVVAVWIVSLGISLAPQLGWKDPGYMNRIAEGKCLVSQDPAIFQAARRRIRKRPGTTFQAPCERRGILRLVARRPREESTAFTITRSTPDHSSTSPEKTSSNGANSAPTTTSIASVTPTTTTTTTTTVTPAAATTIVTAGSQPQITTTKKNRETIEAKRERKAAKTLAIITGAFVACWLPFFVITLGQAICSVCKPPDILASAFLWLGYFNSTLNPVIYTIFSPEFRQAFKRMLRGGARAGITR
ncbi:hypothetical protein PV328_004682 [Microctonus aethiopoides]|uniref:G-protein coupled receptors family 1 profile domain-containing protein n=1 Tax=Microctonus aethiopoides TaxID=144406 RepID=A0AA39FB47_9HYME|nr:hypothetical protein PV328_004682 [Microctonus aethiopoides]